MDLIEKAKAWLANDPDALTRNELAELIQQNNLEELQSRFSTRLQFGTAGLRGELGAGPNRMNRVVISQTALAIARFLTANRSTYQDAAGELSVVIGFDGRTNSDVFAKDSAEIMQAAGINVSLFEFAVPTPVAAFTGRRLGASATIVVTASHNPPRDNGYKVYLGGPNGGSQLISPQDGQIAELIDSIASSITFEQMPKSNLYSKLNQAAVDDYIERAKTLVPESNLNRAELKITYTAMHGVGFAVINQIATALGFSLGSVSAQQEPDGSFPTVAFPNPEEPGAMDLSLEHANANLSDIIIANDPDADRLAVGVKVLNGYQMLTGDQVGLILAELVAGSAKSGSIANSIVSASLAKLGQHHKLPYEQTLTGFKWISKVPNLIYGYEEALGYCVDPSATPDKDGITAAVLIMELAANLKAEGRDLISFLDELAERYGHSATGQVSIRVQDLSIITKIMANIRSSKPSEVAGEGASFEDL
ncbi:MAG: hypothetical protein RL418_723, partial [Actinomycetota bacterium]